MGKRGKAVKQSGDWRRCRVEASVLSVRYNYSRSLGPGAILNLDEFVAGNLQLRDFVREDWFEPAEPPNEPALAEIMSKESDDGATDRP